MPRLPWKRNKQPTVDVQVPPEVEEYYQSTQKDRRGTAWLLAFATLILTILIAAGLFFAGRWAYRAIIGDDESTGTSQGDSGAGEGGIQGGSEDFEAETALPGNGEGESRDGQNDETQDQEDEAPSLPTGPSTDTQSGGSNGVDTQTQTPTAGPGDVEIPRTGPVTE